MINARTEWTKILFLSVVLIGCTKKEETQADPTIQFFTHGDPLSLIKDTSLRQTGLKIADLAKFKNFDMANGAVFTTRTILSEPQRETPAPNSSSKAGSYQFTASPENNGYLYSDANDPTRIKLIFETRNDEIVFKGVAIYNKETKKDEKFAIEHLHTSINSQVDKFSVLGRFNGTDQDEGTGLMALFFTKNFLDQTRHIATDTKYSYIAGKGIGMKWKQNINISVCGKLSADERKALTDGINQWVVNGKIGQTPITVNINENPPPFSDVNENCLFLSQEFNEERSNSSAILGSTRPIINLTRTEIVASNIFIFKKAFNKVNSSEQTSFPNFATAVTTHEVGHFLGLGHEFAKDSRGVAYFPTSIMSYNINSKPAPHDFEALEKLYGAYDPN